MARNDGLRDYQQEMKLRLFEEWELHRSVMVQMPTGTGKTHLLAAVVKEFLCGGGVGMRVWIVAHRRELVEQIEETVARYGMGKEPDKSAKNGERQYAGRIREGEGIFHPVVVTKPEDYGRTAGFDRH